MCVFVYVFCVVSICARVYSVRLPIKCLLMKITISSCLAVISVNNTASVSVYTHSPFPLPSSLSPSLSSSPSPSLTHSQEQYIFINDAILEAVTCGDTQITASDLRRSIQNLSRRDPQTHSTGFESQFKARCKEASTCVNNYHTIQQPLT